VSATVVRSVDSTEIVRVPRMLTITEGGGAFLADRFFARCARCEAHSAEDSAASDGFPSRSAADAAMWAARHRGLDLSAPVDDVCPKRQFGFAARQQLAAIDQRWGSAA
jgi:hypothetical protein